VQYPVSKVPTICNERLVKVTSPSQLLCIVNKGSFTKPWICILATASGIGVGFCMALACKACGEYHDNECFSTARTTITTAYLSAIIYSTSSFFKYPALIMRLSIIAVVAAFSSGALAQSPLSSIPQCAVGLSTSILKGHTEYHHSKAASQAHWAVAAPRIWHAFAAIPQSLTVCRAA
jgi:hypothetical protein